MKQNQSYEQDLDLQTLFIDYKQISDDSPGHLQKVCRSAEDHAITSSNRRIAVK